MIDGIRDWLWGVMAAAICLTVISGWMPKGAIHSIGQICGGLVLLLVMVRPVLSLNIQALDLRFDDYHEEINQQVEAYRTEYDEQLCQRIEKQTAAYISEKAAQMGVDCRVEVKVGKNADAVMLPQEVWLNTTENNTLSSWISKEIGIKPEQQHWEDTA